MVYNPYAKKQSVVYKVAKPCDLFDVVSKRYVARNVQEQTSINIGGHTAQVIYELPLGTKLSVGNGQIRTNDNQIISYK